MKYFVRFKDVQIDKNVYASRESDFGIVSKNEFGVIQYESLLDTSKYKPDEAFKDFVLANNALYLLSDHKIWSFKDDILKAYPWEHRLDQIVSIGEKVLIHLFV